MTNPNHCHQCDFDPSLNCPCFCHFGEKEEEDGGGDKPIGEE